MSEPSTTKKSETLEVRIPYGTKSAFMQRAQSEGRAASEIVREQIDAYLGAEPAPVGRPPSRTTLSRLLKYLAVGIGAAAAAVAIGFAVSPASAQPDLKAAFAALDANRDGVLSLTEFTDPRNAAETEIRNTTIPDEPIAVATDNSDGKVYVRYVLVADASGGYFPLVIAVKAPQGPVSPAEVARLVGDAFGTLDHNGDGKLDTAEFGVR